MYAPQQGFSSACFEAVSCLTTTGVSLFKSTLPQALEFWRVLLQWIGGLGIILMTFSLIPALQTNSSFIIFNEFSQRLEKTTPRTQTMATQIFLLYSTLTIMIAALLWVQYTLPFKTCLHYSMSCLSTGGIEASHAPISGLTYYAKSILILGMIIGALPFLVLLQGIRNVKTIIQDDQVRTYSILMGVSIVFACATPHFSVDYLLSTVSCLTSTGFSCTSPMHPFTTLWWFGLTFLGGCSGSSAGGLKIFRAQILYRITKNHIMQTLYPKRITVAHYNGKAIKPQDLSWLLSGFFIYLTGYVISTLCFALIGYSPKISCLLTCGFITNSGGGVYSLSAYVKNFSPLEHWIGIFTMLLGRLESIFILGIISIFSRLR
jgi:trk system potassium uptake protein TrkH